MSTKLWVMIISFAVVTVTALATKDVYNVNITNNKNFGECMTNETFFTLYYFLNDAPGNGTSQCFGKCAENWPPFYVEDLHVNPELNPVDFTVINREDGSKQLAYEGWPLYLYSGDTEAYQTNGQGVNGVWFIVNPTEFPPKDF